MVFDRTTHSGADHSSQQRPVFVERTRTWRQHQNSAMQGTTR
jgi:hypothetical protein